MTLTLSAKIGFYKDVTYASEKPTGTAFNNTARVNDARIKRTRRIVTDPWDGQIYAVYSLTSYKKPTAFLATA